MPEISLGLAESFIEVGPLGDPRLLDPSQLLFDYYITSNLWLRKHSAEFLHFCCQIAL